MARRGAGEARRAGPRPGGLATGGGNLVKKERAPRHVNTPIEGASRAHQMETPMPMMAICRPTILPVAILRIKSRVIRNA